MSYVPGYLELLSRSETIDGWPKGIEQEAKDFAIDRVRQGLEKFGELDLSQASSCIYKGLIDDKPVPDSLKSPLLDWTFAVTYRALIASHATGVFIPSKPYKVLKTTKVWRRVKVSRADIELLETAMQVTVGATRTRIGKLVGFLRNLV